MTQEQFFKRYTYDIDKDRIGGGGFGTVYKAYDNVLHREVAIKVSEVKTTADGKKTFSLKDEFEALNHIPKHSNIANYEEFYSFEMLNGVFDYAVMQYYPDGNLNNAIKQGLTEEEKEGIATQLLEGIDFLHKHKVVHRDLKPGNILIVRHRGRVIPLITDFGLSKAVDMVDGSMFTNSSVAGTLKYSSPEQLQGKPLRFNTDLWSYGAILYELFSGEQLFTASRGAVNTVQAEMEIYNKIVNGNVQSLGLIPEKWRKVAECCLVVDAGKRVKDSTVLFGIIKGEIDIDVNETEWTESSTSSVSSGNGAINGYTDDDEPEWKEGDCCFKVESQNDDLVFTVNGVSFVMKYVEGGTFQMGATLEQGDDACKEEKPAHGVRLSSYFIGETPVTQALWKAVMGENPSFFIGDDLPVDSVDRIFEFVIKLNKMTGKDFRKPTEAEWEFAARGGNNSKGYKYAGSDDLDRVGWFCENSGLNGWNCKTHPVKLKEPNELGLFDMCGNVLEWCSDYYDNYSDSFQVNPKGPIFDNTGTIHPIVARGGCHAFVKKACRVSSRFVDAGQTVALNWFGLRLALSVE